MKSRNLLGLCSLLALFSACGNGAPKYDATGTFILYKADKGRAYAQKLQRLPRICGQSPCLSLIHIFAAVSINLSKKPYEHELTGVPAEYDGKLRALYMPIE